MLGLSGRFARGRGNFMFEISLVPQGQPGKGARMMFLEYGRVEKRIGRVRVRVKLRFDI